MVHADDMEDAARRAMKQGNIVAHKKVHGFGGDPEYYLTHDDKKIRMYMSVHPEQLLQPEDFIVGGSED